MLTKEELGFSIVVNNDSKIKHRMPDLTAMVHKIYLEKEV